MVDKSKQDHRPANILVILEKYLQSQHQRALQWLEHIYLRISSTVVLLSFFNFVEAATLRAVTAIISEALKTVAVYYGFHRAN